MKKKYINPFPIRTSCIFENKQKNPQRVSAPFSPLHSRISLQSKSELNTKKRNKLNKQFKEILSWQVILCRLFTWILSHCTSLLKFSMLIQRHQEETRVCHSYVVGAAPRVSGPQRARRCCKEIQQVMIKEFQCFETAPESSFSFSLEKAEGFLAGARLTIKSCWLG